MAPITKKAGNASVRAIPVMRRLGSGRTTPAPSGWIAIIGSVKTVLAFAALVVLAVDTSLFSLASKLQGLPQELSLTFGSALILVLIAAIVFLALKRPEALGLKPESNPLFAHMLGSKAYTSLHPYLSNLASEDITEALDFFESRMSIMTVGNSPEEINFRDAFTQAFVTQGRDLQ